MKIIFALGNIGAEYAGTRHNAGFEALDDLAAAFGADWQTKDRLKAIVAAGQVEGESILLAKPTIYYNLAGESAQAILHFYKAPLNDLLVIHDDLDLPSGTLRARLGGSDGGSNGLKSLIAHVGPGFARLRIGVAGEHRQTHDAAGYVLGRFTPDEATSVAQLKPAIHDMVMQFITGNFAATTKK